VSAVPYEVWTARLQAVEVVVSSDVHREASDVAHEHKSAAQQAWLEREEQHPAHGPAPCGWLVGQHGLRQTGMGHAVLHC